jgi:hypothetical protein
MSLRKEVFPMTLKESIEVQEALRVTSKFSDFNGDLDKWKDSFYQLWRLQMTWNFAYQLELDETKSGVYVSMLIKPAFEENVLVNMEGFGYRKIHTYPEKFGMLSYASNEFLDQYIDVVFVE